MPRIKSDEERGHVSAWMRRQRTQRDWSPERVVDELARRGHRIRVDYYRGLEAGRRPGPELLEAFEYLYGPLPEPQKTPALGASAIAVDAAIRAQTEAIILQTEVLREVLTILRAGRNVGLEALATLAAAEGQADETMATRAAAPGPPAAAHAGVPRDRP